MWKHDTGGKVMPREAIVQVYSKNERQMCWWLSEASRQCWRWYLIYAIWHKIFAALTCLAKPSVVFHVVGSGLLVTKFLSFLFDNPVPFFWGCRSSAAVPGTYTLSLFLLRKIEEVVVNTTHMNQSSNRGVESAIYHKEAHFVIFFIDLCITSSLKGYN